MISLLLGFVVVLDVLKYVFHIDVAAAEQETLRQKQKRVLGIRRAQRPPVIVRYAYISWSDQGENKLWRESFSMKSHHSEIFIR